MSSSPGLAEPEQPKSTRFGGWQNPRSLSRRRIYVVVGALCAAVLIISAAVFIPLGISVIGPHAKHEPSAETYADELSQDGTGVEEEVPLLGSLNGTINDPLTWKDKTDFNMTYTDETVGGLPLLGLNSTWDDTARANMMVPPLNKPFPYGDQPIRGVNIGGWLSIEPFITPDFFSRYEAHEGIVDEWSLCKKLGSNASEFFADHYSSFVREETFAEIREAGLDHVRIPYPYWIVETYDDDPYVEHVGWRFLLRGLEWARKYGLRVKLDFHAVPGNQNGWNHGGKQGTIGWLNGTHGQLNAKRSLKLHERLAAFFAQDRYKNLVTMYGLVNEPNAPKLVHAHVLDWTKQAIQLVRKSNYNNFIVVGDGMQAPNTWPGLLPQKQFPKTVLDTHEYQIFHTSQISQSHAEKLKYACTDWPAHVRQMASNKTGFGPTIVGEFSLADTDCARYLNAVGAGTRWTGGHAAEGPSCPTPANCTCEPANAPAEEYSNGYLEYLRHFALAQLESFETSWGFFYWTWDTQDAPQWSYKKAREAGILPLKAYARVLPDGSHWSCSNSTKLIDYTQLGLPESY